MATRAFPGVRGRDFGLFEAYFGLFGVFLCLFSGLLADGFLLKSMASGVRLRNPRFFGAEIGDGVR
jgi:hypothetical protein